MCIRDRLILLTSCAPPTKKEALDHYIHVKFEIAYDVLARLDNQRAALNEFMGDPSKLTKGPDGETHNALLTEQQEIIPAIRDCIKNLEDIDRIGDDAEYLDNLIVYLYTRLNLEENITLRIIELLEGGMTPEEATFLEGKTTDLLYLQEKQEALHSSERSFLDEFGISDSEIEDELIKKRLMN